MTEGTDEGKERLRKEQTIVLTERVEFGETITLNENLKEKCFIHCPKMLEWKLNVIDFMKQ